MRARTPPLLLVNLWVPRSQAGKEGNDTREESSSCVSTTKMLLVTRQDLWCTHASRVRSDHPDPSRAWSHGESPAGCMRYRPSLDTRRRSPICQSAIPRVPGTCPRGLSTGCVQAVRWPGLSFAAAAATTVARAAGSATGRSTPSIRVEPICPRHFIDTGANPSTTPRNTNLTLAHSLRFFVFLPPYSFLTARFTSSRHSHKLVCFATLVVYEPRQA